MADQNESPGEREAYRSGRVDEELGDAEGHKRYFRATDTDEPPNDADAEGQGLRWGRVEQDDDAAGHMPRTRVSDEAADPRGEESETAGDDAEGHARRRAEDDDDAEGHIRRWSDRNRKVNITPVTW
jgi:hypothetical protein